MWTVFLPSVGATAPGQRGAIGSDVGASLIGAGMISVLAFPLVATALSGRRPATERPEAIPEY